MSKGKVLAALFIVVFLLIVAVICTWLVSSDAKPEPEILTPEQTAVIPTAPVVTQSPATPAPVVTPSPTPAPTPTPVPTPTPAPVYTEQSLGSGSFVSNTGEALNLRADWSARTVSGSQVEITVKISVDSMSLISKGYAGAVNLSVGDQYVSMASADVNHTDNTAINTVFGTHTFTVNLAAGTSNSYPMQVEWHFGGTYHNVVFDVIECGGTINLSR